MPDYAKLYHRIFNSVTDAIVILQNAQQETEELFVSSPAPDIRVLETKSPDEDDTPKKD